MTELAAAILNGGRAQRFHGRDKAQIVVGGQSILAAQLSFLRAHCQHIAVVQGADKGPPPAGVASLRDRIGGLGPLDGIASALAWSPSPWTLILASDMPSPQPAVLELLLAERGEGDVVACRVQDRVQPLFALYRQAVLPAVDELLAERRLRLSSFLQAPPAGLRVHILDEARVRIVDPKLLCFRNFNRPEDVLTSPISIE